MMRNQKLLITAAMAALLAAPAMAVDQAAIDKATAEAKAITKALGEAKVALNAANAAGGEWRDSRKILKMAEKAAARGEVAKAVELAGMAKFQAIEGREQAEAQQDAGNPGYLYN
jgi:hypothetical protein